MHKSLRRAIILMIAPAAGAVTPLVALPALSATGGPESWASVAVGQSVGLGLATLLELGWGLTGPQSAARRTPASRRRLIALSLRTRALLLLPLGFIAFGVSWAIAPTDPLLSAVASVSSLLTGMTLTWYFIGIDRALHVLWTDSLPRLTLVVASAMLMLFGASPIVYPAVGLAGGSIAALVIGVWIARPAWRQTRWGWKRLFALIANQRHVVAGRGVSALYISLPPALLAVVSPSSVALFAAVDRLQRMGLAMLTAIPSALQAKVGQTPPSQRVAVARRAVAVNLIVAVIAGTVCFLLLPPVANLVFARTLTVTVELSILSGVVVALVVCSRAIGGLLLVAQQRFRAIARSAYVGAIVGVPAVLALGSAAGALGALGGQALAEGSVLATQVVESRRRS